MATPDNEELTKFTTDAVWTEGEILRLTKEKREVGTEQRIEILRQGRTRPGPYHETTQIRAKGKPT